MFPTRQWTHHLSQLRNRAAKLRGHNDATGATRRLIDEALSSCAELLDDFNRAQVECGRLLEDTHAAIQAHKRLFDSVPCPCVVTDQHGTILTANSAAGRLLNITSKRLEGRELLLYSHNRDAFMRILEKLPMSETPQSVPVIMRPRERRPLETTVTVMPAAENQPGVWLWFFISSRDVLPFEPVPAEITREIGTSTS
jgi:PAS domain S-box-containing protein